MKPILKYPGGKSRELDLILPHVPESYSTYYEPFLGGGAVYFALNPEKAAVSDINQNLISFYTGLCFNTINVMQDLNELRKLYLSGTQEKRQALYYKVRDEFNHPTGAYEKAAVYYFINKLAYAGMMRFNSNGEFNVPFGKYKNFNIDCITHEHISLLRRTAIVCEDYSFLFRQSGDNDFMFLDPPYDCVFNHYGNGVNDTEIFHDKLAEDYKRLQCKALMIINRTSLTEDLYREYICKTYRKLYSVNIKNRFDRDAEHLVIKNY